MQSHMPSQHRFSVVPQAEIERSQFDRSHCLKTTFDTGYLVPIFFDEALPGDTFNLNLTVMARLSSTALLRPIMDNLFLDTFFFFVPNRLLWTHWANFMGEQLNPGDSTSYTVPQVIMPAFGAGGVPSNTLFDYLGVPTGTLAAANTGVAVDALHSRGYNLIFREWFRDQNLQNSPTVDTGDGPDTYGNYVLLRRGKRHDYFTSCLPWPQKNNAGAVTIPLGTSATVKTSASNLIGAGIGQPAPMQIQRYDTGVLPVGTIMLSTDVSGNFNANALAPGASGVSYAPMNLYADLTNATAATINSLRQAFQLQKLYERDARGGTRYIEMVQAHFGVTSPDLRATRPVYLGGGSVPINVNPVSGTNQLGTTTTAAGVQIGYATASGYAGGFSQSFTEHGVLLGLASVRADLTYQQGLPRMYARRTRFDYYFPALAHIGEQAVLNREIYCVGPGGASTDAAVFGYQEAFAEYRYKPSVITGAFRSQATTTPIDQWHLAQNFGALPTLNTTFIQETPPVSRVVAVTTEPQILFDSYFKLICARPMPVFGVPGLIDHF